MDEILKSLEAWQDEWIKGNPVYFQALRTHKKIPSTSKQPDNIDKVIPRKNIKWSDTAIGLPVLDFSIEVHEYQGPQGKGWQVLFKKVRDTKLLIKSVGYGPEPRTYDWREIRI